MFSFHRYFDHASICVSVCWFVYLTTPLFVPLFVGLLDHASVCASVFCFTSLTMPQFVPLFFVLLA